ncbi:hypothetical protein OHU11_30005 [Streptomyces sp. NBC_00257]|uniref:hypothetical protein n=1 Tax=unclassified Streptomyces TaxID=2593676 RepID=UPI002252F6E8|nr:MULTISPECIES: hypothetical protein [unclassified Streptomyces]MCX5431886.1 hypothetical protein [Streptomyces sp. NBC_00062]
MADVPEKPEEVKRLVEAIEAFEAIEDDEVCAVAVSQALEGWPDHQTRLRELRQQRVQALKRQGKTWKEIGQLLGGISAARAQQISVGLSGAQRRKADKKAQERAAE